MTKTLTQKKKRNQSRASRKVPYESLASSSMVSAPIGGSVVVRRRNPPRIQSRPTGTIVCNTEQFTNVQIQAAGAFSSNRAFFAPWNYTWLNGIAQNYSKFRWVKLRYIYVPNCPTTTAGQMVLSLGFSTSDGAVTSMQQAQQAFHSITSPPWAGYEGAICLSEPDKAAPSGAIITTVDVNRFGTGSGLTYYKYTTQATWNTFSTSEREAYAPGYINISTSGSNVALLEIGNLFIQYEIELIEPIANAIN